MLCELDCFFVKQSDIDKYFYYMYNTYTYLYNKWEGLTI